METMSKGFGRIGDPKWSDRLYLSPDIGKTRGLQGELGFLWIKLAIEET